jgi:hypothetical protein
VKHIISISKFQMKIITPVLKFFSTTLIPINLQINKWILRLNFLQLLIITIFVPQVTLANDYFVANTGNDTNQGTQSLPWKTLSHAANVLMAGDTVYIGSGTYSERLIPANSGTNGQYISFTSQAGASVIIDGTTPPLPDYDSGLVHIEGRSYIRVSGLNIRNAGPFQNNSGIFIDTSSNIKFHLPYFIEIKQIILAK